MKHGQKEIKEARSMQSSKTRQQKSNHNCVGKKEKQYWKQEETRRCEHSQSHWPTEKIVLAGSGKVNRRDSKLFEE